MLAVPGRLMPLAPPRYKVAVVALPELVTDRTAWLPPAMPVAWSGKSTSRSPVSSFSMLALYAAHRYSQVLVTFALPSPPWENAVMPFSPPAVGQVFEASDITGQISPVVGALLSELAFCVAAKIGLLDGTVTPTLQGPWPFPPAVTARAAPPWAG